jgi:hypothetical protein
VLVSGAGQSLTPGAFEATEDIGPCTPCAVRIKPACLQRAISSGNVFAADARAITVNLVNPGTTDTELNPADGPDAETINGFTALGHYAAPTDMAAAVAFLAGPDGRYITGCVHLRLPIEVHAG